MLRTLTTTIIDKIRKNQLIKNTSIYLISRLIPQLLEFLLLPVLSKELTPDDYGITGTMNSYSGVFIAVLSLGLSSFLVRNYYDKQVSEEDKRSAVSTIITFELINLALIIGLLLLVGPMIWPILTSNQIPFYPYGQLVFITIFCMTLNGLPVAVFQARQQPARYAVYSIFASVSTIILSLIFTIQFHMGAYGLMMSKVICYSTVSLIGCGLILFENKAIHLRFQVIKNGLRYGIPLVPLSVSGWILKFSDRLVLERFVSITQLGLYNFGYSMATIFQIIIDVINVAWTPIYYDLRNNHDHKKIVQTFSAYFCVISLVCLGGILFVKDLFVILFPAKYHNSYLYTVLVIVGYYFMGIYRAAALPLLFYKKTSMVALVTVVAAISNIGINIYFVPIYGVMVAAYSTTFCYMLMAILGISFSRKFDPVAYPYLRSLFVIISILVCFVFFQFPASEMVNIYFRGLLFISSSLLLGILFLGEIIPDLPAKLKTLIHR
jgi:O-antigen/teichoic acid export membrane protein